MIERKGRRCWPSPWRRTVSRSGAIVPLTATLNGTSLLPDATAWTVPVWPRSCTLARPGRNRNAGIGRVGRLHVGGQFQLLADNGIGGDDRPTDMDFKVSWQVAGQVDIVAGGADHRALVAIDIGQLRRALAAPNRPAPIGRRRGHPCSGPVRRQRRYQPNSAWRISMVSGPLAEAGPAYRQRTGRSRCRPSP